MSSADFFDDLLGELDTIAPSSSDSQPIPSCQPNGIGYPPPFQSPPSRSPPAFRNSHILTPPSAFPNQPRQRSPILYQDNGNTFGNSHRQQAPDKTHYHPPRQSRRESNMQHAAHTVPYNIPRQQQEEEALYEHGNIVTAEVESKAELLDLVLDTKVHSRDVIQ